MSGGVQTGGLVRSIVAISLDAQQAREERQLADWQRASDEYDQQFKLPCSFKVLNAPVIAEVNVTFTTGFHPESPNDSEHDRPTFTYGFEHRAGEPLVMSAMVKDWRIDNNLVIGARIVVMASFPTPIKLAKPKLWSGLLHANFQGYATPLPEPDDEIADEEQ